MGQLGSYGIHADTALETDNFCCYILLQNGMTNYSSSGTFKSKICGIQQN